MTVQTVKFTSFGHKESGRLITHCNGLEVVQSRNPYGTHNLVLVNAATGEAIRHGTVPVLEAVANWLPTKTYRRVRKYLAKKGKGTDWVAINSNSNLTQHA